MKLPLICITATNYQLNVSSPPRHQN